jgi:hypothetical protein
MNRHLCIVAHEIASPFGRGLFNGKPKASANPAHSRLRLAVERGHYFVSVAIVVLLLVLPAFADLPGEEQNGDLGPLDWPEATEDARPWAYWWWMGSAVDEASLAWNLKTCRDAGYGGLHVIPIYGVKGYENKYIDYLSPKWMEMLAFTVEEARRLDMGIDMTTGTGWCFGGPNVPDRDACANIVVKVEKVQAGGRLVDKVDRQKTHTLMAYSDKGDVVEITDKIAADGSVEWTAPDGDWHVYAISQKLTGRRVKRAAPGGDGWMLNAFSVRAIENYLQRFDEAFADYDGSVPRAMYHDSYEYQGNWADDLFAEFEARRGYRLQDHLPALQGKASADEVARVRTDYNETLSDMHLAYIKTWVQWVHGKGCKTRDQAHGSPSNLLDTYAAADIPETEMFNKDRDVFVSKFASSAAHVMDKRLVAAETGTWLADHFTVTLGQMKTLVDLLFLSGVNHVVYHGTCYSPPDDPWPGWLFYASTEMNSRNAIWRDVPALNAYITRCQSVLQSGKPDGDVLVYWPIHDFWHQRSAMKINFSVHTRWQANTAFRAVVERLWERGFQFDCISDRQLAHARASGGAVEMPGATYRTLVIPSGTVIRETTMQAVLQLAASGATVVFDGRIPDDVPGLGNLDQRRTKLRGLLASLELQPADGMKRGHVGSGQVIVADNVCDALSAAGVKREEMVDHSGVQFVRRRHNGGCHYFIVNSGQTAVDAWSPLATDLKSAVLMDPMTGNCGVSTVDLKNADRPRVHLQLSPGQSCIVRTFCAETIEGPRWTYLEETGEPVELRGKWSVEFIDGGPKLPQPFTTENLGSWTTSDDPEAQRFAGTARYTLAFDAPRREAEAWQLDLGDVCHSARVTLNGKHLGTRINAPYRVHVDSLRKTGNVLEVEVTNLSANRIRDLDRRGVAWRKFHNINFVNIDYRPFDASEWPLRPSGLLGPVTLIPCCH